MSNVQILHIAFLGQLTLGKDVADVFGDDQSFALEQAAICFWLSHTVSPSVSTSSRSAPHSVW